MELLIYFSSLYCLGYFIKLVTMALHDTLRTKNAQDDGLTVDPLYSMEEFLYLPALWPMDVVNFLRGVR